jgi:diguanylate cyclase (GGDEF)-like protein
MLYCYFYSVQTDAGIDTLTGLGNRYWFTEFTNRLSRSRPGRSWNIAMLDMDHLKKINDTLGHQEGDNALRGIASIIKKNIRSNDFAARFGGDEFVIIIKHDTHDEGRISAILAGIQKDVELYNRAHTGPFMLAISYGYDMFTQDGRQPVEEFLNHIDGLMYKNKRERRRSSDNKGGTA